MLVFYDQQGRKNLPWQLKKTAYRVWVSEIMLQQTQVKTVIPYYLKFIQFFPTVNKLANTHIDEVLNLWAGLGYYSRARNLHACAKIIVAQYAGKFPKDMGSMMKLPGIGESTAGAILSLAYGLPEAILDGNVKRVLSRVFLVNGWPGNTKVSKILWQLSKKYTPKIRTADFNQAMMDLGASWCGRAKPMCELCPLTKDCLAKQQNKTAEYPHKKAKKVIPTKQSYLGLIFNQQGQIQLCKRPPVGIWGGLWSLPEITQVNPESRLVEKIKHTFSHFHLQIKVLEGKQSHRIEDNLSLKWHNIKDLNKLAFPAPIKKFLYQQFQIKENR